MINIGVIGLGYWGPNLVRNFQEVANCRVTMACDSREDRRQALQRRYPGVVTAGDAKELIESAEVDAVAIATPVATHFALANSALLNGKHVLLEKPMTARVREGEELVAIAHDVGRVLMAAYTFVYANSIRCIRDLISSGQIGSLLYLDSVRVNLGLFRSDVNVLWDLAAHDISILRYLTGGEPERVSVVARDYDDLGLESVAYVTLEYPEGFIGHIHVSWLSPVKIRRMIMGGSSKMIVFDDVEPSEKIRIYDCGVEFTSGREDPLHPTYRLGDVWIPRLDHREPLMGEVEHFVECISNGSTPITDGVFGLGVLRVLEACNRALGSAGGQATL
jgi:predicted dehydrogenase